MRALSESLAVRRYLQRHAEQPLPAPPSGMKWQQVLVIPAYRESPELVRTLQTLPAAQGRTLVVLVVNRPDTDADTSVNDSLRDAIRALPPAADDAGQGLLFFLREDTDLLLLDLEAAIGAVPAALGVGLARKCGCDMALQWMVDGAIATPWIYCTDADATLPDDYFSRLEAVDAPAAVFPFVHVKAEDPACHEATLLYEQCLAHYVSGLALARSPYAFHTIGSCIAIQAEAYAQVRGFPQRAGAEDFYLLNKLAKLAPVVSLEGDPVRLAARVSNRVPFGTGPAVKAIMADGPLEEQPLFYAPGVFDALQAVLVSVPFWAAQSGDEPIKLSSERPLDTELTAEVVAVLEVMKLGDALAHCRRQSNDKEQFARQFHQWFDGFRTLKFIHALTARAMPKVSLSQLQGSSPVNERWKSTPSGKA
ncbi:MAG: hypothetical protein ACPG1A_02070 [Halioglobus sp.]